MTDVQRLKVMAERCIENAGAGSGIPIRASSVLELIADVDRHKENVHRTGLRFLEVCTQRDQLKAENEVLRRGLKGDYDLDAWLDWAKEAEALRKENERLQRFETAYKEFSDKTDWVRPNAATQELGMHVADILRKRCADLTSHNQAQADEIVRLQKVAGKWLLVEKAMDQLQCDEQGAAIWSACSRILISVAHELNSSTSTVTQEGVTVGEKEIGDWSVTVARIKPASAQEQQP
jgi:hypothetical protein